jgi:hypothetical protein
MLLIFTQDHIPRWEVRRKGEKVDGLDGDLIVAGAADTFEAAKAAALFEATTQSSEWHCHGNPFLLVNTCPRAAARFNDFNGLVLRLKALNQPLLALCDNAAWRLHGRDSGRPKADSGPRPGWPERR